MYEDPVQLATVVIAVAAIINLVASFLLWGATRGYAKTTKDIFEAAHRPYLSIAGHTPMCHQDQKKITFTLIVKNSGSTSAGNLALSCKVKVEGQDRVKNAGVEAWALMPQESMTFTILIHDPDVYNVLVKDSDVTFLIQYTGAKNQNYKYEQRATYKDRQLFLKGSTES